MNFKKKLIAVATLLTVAAASMTSAFGGFTSSADFTIKTEIRYG